MDLKSILKNLKLNENNVSMLLGAAVIVVVGLLIVNYFKNINTGSTSTVGTTTTDQTSNKLPTKYTVQAGDSLWSIAEKYYQSGYNWVDIQKANNLSNASMISVGQELTIPDVTPKLAGAINKKDDMAMATPVPNTKLETVNSSKDAAQGISESTYVVAHGDNLWTIAVRAYGDGFQWKKIASANKLANPRIIHAGNVLILPR